MNTKNQNTDLGIGRSLMFGIFFIALFTCANIDSRNDITANQHFSIANISEINSNAIVAEPYKFPNTSSLLTLCLNSETLSNFGNSFFIQNSNLNTIVSFKLCKKKYIEIKPEILSINCYTHSTSVLFEEYTSIS